MIFRVNRTRAFSGPDDGLHELAEARGLAVNIPALRSRCPSFKSKLADRIY